MAKEFGPIFGVELIDELRIGGGLEGVIIQRMPSLAELRRVSEVSQRTVAGYEVLLSHWRGEKAESQRLAAENEKLRNYIASIKAQLQFFPDLTPSAN